MSIDQPAEVPADLVDLGAVRGAYGVRGWARVQPFDADAAVLSGSQQWWLRRGDRVELLDVTASRRHSSVLLAKWHGWETPEAVDAVKGATVAVPRSVFPPLPPGEYYWTDLIGARVVNREAVELGTVQSLASNGAQDLLEVVGPQGSTLVPLVPAYVDDVDVAARLIRVDWQQDWS